MIILNRFCIEIKIPLDDRDNREFLRQILCFLNADKNIVFYDADQNPITISIDKIMEFEYFVLKDYSFNNIFPCFRIPTDFQEYSRGNLNFIDNQSFSDISTKSAECWGHNIYLKVIYSLNLDADYLELNVLKYNGESMSFLECMELKTKQSYRKFLNKIFK